MSPHPFRFRLAGACVLAALAALPGIRAQEEAGRPVFRDFRPTDYRGHPQAFSLVESPEGFLYLGNQEGVIEFDGARWTHLPAPTSLVYRLAFGADGKLWAGGNDEVGYYLPDASGRRVYHSVRHQLPAEMLPFGPAAVVTDGPRTYITGPRGVVQCEDGRFTAWPNPTPGGVSLHRVGGEMLALVAGTGLFRLEPGGRRTLVSDAPAFRGSARTASAPLPDGRVLFVVTHGGAYVFDPRTGTAAPLPGPLDDIARGTRINDALRLPSGEIAVATAAQGLVVLSPDLRRIRRFDRSTGLADNGVISLALDRDGGLWVGFNSGLARLAIDSPVTVFDATNGPTPGTVDAWGRHAGRLYAGTYDGLYRLEPATADGAPARFARISDQVVHIFGFASHRGRLLVAAQAGLYQFDEDDRPELVVDCRANSPFGLLPSPRVPGRFYLPAQSGLVIVEHDATGWHTRADLRTLGDAHTAVLDDEGSLWLGTYNRGFWRLPRADTTADVSTLVPEQFFNGRGLPGNMVWTNVTPGVGGPVFFTDKGQRRFDPQRGAFVPEDRFALPDSAAPLFTPTLVNGTDTWGSLFRDSTIVAASALGRFRADGGKLTWQSAPADALSEIGFSGAAVMWLDDTPAARCCGRAATTTPSASISAGRPPRRARGRR
ncbi:ligand-binding sensor domain-containing protein [Oleiharenicola sp. Vm1]|uniref:ligand-binding sensor domain-containing protein n=1 Tax=Oleiharenicola sp. Vm1 TaxID=3398393 RepID=UPI0039F4DD66